MALYEEFEPRPNRLITASSAYLRSAAYQPVGWYEFSPEAFAEAQRQDKPILLDIGAAWCHWCHVIDRESYENPEIATLINELFIPIKVDRDERPDIDSRYQAAVQILAGQGGWPLTVFLTPDGTPYYGGTYFPPDDRYGQTGLKNLLPRLSHAYKNRRHELEDSTRVLKERMQESYAHAGEPGALGEETFREIARGLRSRFNNEMGGFEHTGPKFPHPGAVELALLLWGQTGNEEWRTIAGRTLLAMGVGGIYDHLGGGFHRYSTDATWTVPHFEKLGADNALLLENYTHAYRATNELFFREIALGIVDFILHDLTDYQHGGFYSSQDADNSMHDDGAYWTWSFEEVTEALTREESAVLLRYFGVRRRGNMPETGRNVLRVTESTEQIARELELPMEEVSRRIAEGKRKLLEVRRRRKAPAIDTNKYAPANALLISALLEAGTLLDREDATRAALRTVDTLLERDYEPDHGIYHALLSGTGARLPGLFEDQAYMAKALLDAFMVAGKPEYLATARRLLDLCIEQYWDEEHGGFLDVARARRDAEVAAFMQQPRKGIEDLPTPAPNAIAALALDRLWLLTQEDRYHAYAGKALEAFAANAPGYGPFAGYYGLAVYYHLRPPAAAFIIGAPQDARTRDLWHSALQTYRPGRMAAVFPPDAEHRPYPPSEDGRPIAYVCAGQACAPPTDKPDHLRHALQEIGKPRQEHEE